MRRAVVFSEAELADTVLGFEKTVKLGLEGSIDEMELEDEIVLVIPRVVLLGRGDAPLLFLEKDRGLAVKGKPLAELFAGYDAVGFRLGRAIWPNEVREAAA